MIEVCVLNPPLVHVWKLISVLQSMCTAAWNDRENWYLVDVVQYKTCPNTVFVCVSRLFTYPPPPAVGGICVTNEDLYCLNDGEFLNDVIIEFYIKWVCRFIHTACSHSVLSLMIICRPKFHFLSMMLSVFWTLVCIFTYFFNWLKLLNLQTGQKLLFYVIIDVPCVLTLSFLQRNSYL